MPLTTLYELRAERAHYKEMIYRAKARIEHLEKSYESLRIFKSEVSRSESEFNGVNDKRSSILSDVKAVGENCKTAQRYYSGMKNILSSIGSRIIGVVFRGLRASVQVKLRAYLDTIEDLEDDIAAYQRKIKQLDKRIAAFENSAGGWEEALRT